MLLNLFLLMQPQGADGGGSTFMTLLPFLAIILIMYFLIMRPQMKKQKERQRMVEALKKGDNIITSGGIHGKVMGFTDNDQTIILRVDDNVKINIDRSAVSVVKNK